MHDHMHAQRPDFIICGRGARARPREQVRDGAAVPPLHDSRDHAGRAGRRRFRSGSATKALRVVGDPKAKVSRIQLGVGYATPAINSPDVDVVVSGEQQESDGCLDSPAYVLDAVTLGIPKGWIMLGHDISEEQGMLEMAQWVKSFTPEVPVQLVRAGEPFWAP